MIGQYTKSDRIQHRFININTSISDVLFRNWQNWQHCRRVENVCTVGNRTDECQACPCCNLFLSRNSSRRFVIKRLH